MELFPAANDDQWTLIQRVIDDCDYYLIIIAGRYGSVAKRGVKDRGTMSWSLTEYGDDYMNRLMAIQNRPSA
jgi:Domain of unknown function (DUF4062)